ncbi:MAG: hypothetical protein A3I24_02240 [Candidatus Harrisonbacteria bacterium RIFCSPLOWO2_02_FULL_41_13b]|uniref:Uncharacterized protein n=1 Tax=Candidatus Harrisonbacteria bacterium RIFCSPLOWO2_02_FULL_41_13b TaxID=1798409 RepID=A0A1G1ZVS7_9BACT|nr:MAG: hypothetical protein A3J53_03495 [Candidatus Harrisonbacteria bacterium RIFCSPHIGHO2_02_FULL_40_20]OGY68226.1 MAG: hypothetical protein A3I24_02240 [Candidatus Harrisonbacteria bacterium RIFCSPLOWO2_02_FULL_41_13b]
MFNNGALATSIHITLWRVVSQNWLAPGVTIKMYEDTLRRNDAAIANFGNNPLGMKAILFNNGVDSGLA